MNTDTIQNILILALPVIFAITIRESAQGYAARYFGDHTAEMLGRITLNPLKHIDPIGTILMPLLLYFGSDGNFLFGYAKPVPINSRNLKNPRRDMVWIALAGPASNFIQATLWMIVLIALYLLSVNDTFFVRMTQGGIMVNLVLWALNLLPLPPLDGGRIAVGLLPWKAASTLSRIEPFGFWIVLGLALTGVLWQFWLNPVTAIGLRILSVLQMPFT